MYLPFDQLPGHSRIWIYPSDRPLTAVEQDTIASSLHEFCSGWKAHGNLLHTSFQIAQDHFIILAADEQTAEASGCSIDGSVRHLKQLGAQLRIDFFNRTLVPFFKDGKVTLIPLTALKQAFQSGDLDAETLTFNTLTATIGDLKESWMVPAGRSWLSRYVPSVKSA
ncbi:MAG: hypothetical protein ACKORJ_13675 [Bacteroidota bacterium]